MGDNFLKFILGERERECESELVRMCMCKLGRSREREEETECQAGSTLSTEPDVGPDLMTLGSQFKLQSRVRCLGRLSGSVG